MCRHNLVTILLTFFPLLSLAQAGAPDARGSMVEAASLLSRYIQQPSQTGSEKEAGAFLAALCREKGLYVEVFSAEHNSYNFAASLYPLAQGKPNIILLNHIDVVPASRDTSSWTYPPYSGAVADGMVWGRGALDNKGMAIMQLFALAELVTPAAKQPFPYNITILSVSSEEIGGKLGAGLVTERFLERLNATLVLGEGGAGLSGLIQADPARQVFGIETAQKQGMQLKLHLRVSSLGHGSVPPEEYANKEMVQALGKLLERKPSIRITKPVAQMFQPLGEHEGGFRGFALRHPWLLKLLGKRHLRQDPLIHSLVTNTITVTGIANPTRGSNQIPQRVTATLDCRLLPGTNQDDFIRRLKSTLGEKDMEIEVIAAFVQAGATDPDNPYFRLLSRAVRQVYPKAVVVPILFPASNDNSYFRAKGVPSFGLLPIHLEQDLILLIHNKNERIPIEALSKGIAVYSDFMQALLFEKKESAKYSTFK